MSINEFVSRPDTRFTDARCGKFVALLAAGITFSSVSTGHAAMDRFAEFPTAETFLHVTSTAVYDLYPVSFNERFNGLPTAPVGDLIFSPIDLSLTEPETTASLPSVEKPARLPHRQIIVTADEPIVGIASMYDPNDTTDMDAGNDELASGEHYNPQGWTAAIRTDLREKFGGVRFGSNYRPAFALVQANDKQAIVKINDVGPLKPGRIIDLNRHAMSYFDPTLQLGLIGDVKVTLLAGQDWALGPIVDDQPVAVASRTDQQSR
jgi:rare lipoprotein A